MRITLVTALVLLASRSVAQPQPLENLPVAWRYLQWQARSGVLRAGAEAWLATESGEGPPVVTGAVRPTLLRARWDAPFSAPTESRTWLGAADGRIIEWETLRKDTWKLRRLLPAGLQETVARPASSGERKLAPGSWSLRTESMLPPPPDGVVPADSLAILYVACAAVATGVPEGDTVVKLDTDGRSVQRLVWARGATAKVEIASGGEVEVPRGRLSVEGLGPLPERLLARRVTLSATPLTGEAAGAFELFGLQESIEILVAPATGLPLLITGRVPKVGLVRVTLVRATGAGVPTP